MAESLALATAYVEFVSKGVNDVFRDIDQTKKRIDDVHQSAGRAAAAPRLPGPAVGTDGAALAGGLGGGLSAAGLAGVMAAVKGLEAMAKAGLEGTGQMQQLRFEFEQLSRGIAAVFLPAIEAVTDVVRSLANWFRGLSEGQQNVIQGLVLGATAAKAMSAAMAALGVESTIATGGLSLLVGALAAVAAGGGGGGALGKLGDAFSGLMDAIKPVIDVVGEVLDTAFAAIEPAIGPVVEAVRVLGETFGTVFAQLADDLQPFIEAMAGQLAQTVTVVANIIASLAPVLEVLGEAFGMVAEAMAQFIEFFGELGVSMIAPIAGALGGLKPVFDELMVSFSELGEAFREVMEAARPILDEMGAAFQELMDSILVPVLKFIITEFVEGIKFLIDTVVKAVAVLKAIDKLGLKALDPAVLKAEIQAQYEGMKDAAAARRAGRKPRPGPPGRKVEPAPGSFISPEELFKKIQQAAGSGGKSPEERAADAAEEGNKILEDIRDGLKPGDKGGEHKPPPAENN